MGGPNTGQVRVHVEKAAARLRQSSGICGLGATPGKGECGEA